MTLVRSERSAREAQRRVPAAEPPAHAPAAGTLRDFSARGERLHGLAQLSRAHAVAQAMPEPAENRTGLPDGLKAGVETLSGVSLDSVKVHYNSAEPSRLGALAYAQGSDIHLASGQEHHLPHETWHIAQQAQGRVRPTMQAAGGVPVNDDAGLEREADVMGAKALQAKVAPSQTGGLRRTSANTGPVQGLFDDLRHPNRKMGAEITEGNTGPNRLSTAVAQAGVAGLAPGLWQTVNLPDHTGAAHNWSVGTFAAVGAQFLCHYDKHARMRWGDVSMTEDHGEFEWIVHHPAAEQPMSYYRTRLNEVNQSRQAMRAALSPIGNDLIVATSPAPGPNGAFRVQLGATPAASAQITFESTTAATTKKVLYEGLSHGLNKRSIPAQATLANVTPDIVTAAKASAARVAYPTIDRELLMVYLYGDLIHKIAVILPGPVWAGGAAGNAKNWRNLFPKSRPYQVTQQAFGRAPNAGELAMLTAALDGARAAVVQDILTLVASKLVSPTGARMIWRAPTPPGDPNPDPGHFGAGQPDPGGHIFNASNAPVAPPGGPVGLAALATNLGPFLDANLAITLGAPAALTDEYDHVRDAFVDAAGANVPQVVRSNDAGFAQHAPGTSGFATEDRGEVQTAFPGLDTTYDRIKTLAKRF